MSIGIVNNSGVSAALSAVQSAAADSTVETTVLKKALNIQAATAATLLQALPPPPALATQGAVGTRLNTYA